jgi:hypothetical protein
LAAAGLTFYGIVLAASPVLHHDLICHLKTPTHCDACHASPVAPQAVALVHVAPPDLAASASIENREETAALALVPLRSSGRAPPA